MWITKFNVGNTNNRFVELAAKHNIIMYYYPLNSYIKNNNYHYIAATTLQGEPSDIKNFSRAIIKIRDAEKSKTVANKRMLEYLEIEGNFMFVITSSHMSSESKQMVSIFYNPAVIHLKPVRVEKTIEEWEIASADRGFIEDIIKVGQKNYGLILKAFYWKKIKNLGFLTIFPEITDKQLAAVESAIKHGYYEYPRRTSLDKLSKISKHAFSTFQAHVRKAENKIIRFAITTFRNNRG